MGQYKLNNKKHLNLWKHFLSKMFFYNCSGRSHFPLNEWIVYWLHCLALFQPCKYHALRECSCCMHRGAESKRIEYILEWNLENPSVWIFSVSVSLKCTNHVNVHKLYAVEYINTSVCSLDYLFQFRIF